MARLSKQWREQQAEARRLDAAIEENLARLGFGVCRQTMTVSELIKLLTACPRRHARRRERSRRGLRLPVTGANRPGQDSRVMSQQATNTGWRTATVEDIAEKVAMGPFGSSIKVETFVPEGVPIISGQHLRGFRDDDAPGFNYITDEHAQRLANANVMRGDIVFTHAGNIGQAAYIPQNSKFDHYVISQRQFYLRCDQTKAHPRVCHDVFQVI